MFYESHVFFCYCNQNNSSLFVQERAEKELDKLKKTIEQKELELERLKPQYEEEKKKEEEFTRE